MKIERIKGVAWRKVGDEMVVIHLAKHRIFGLDSTGERIWEALEEPRNLECIEAMVAEDVPECTNVIDAVNRFIADLADEGLVEVDGEIPKTETGGHVIEFKTPRIEWREELQQFAGQCNLISGQGGPCDQFPSGS